MDLRRGGAVFVATAALVLGAAGCSGDDADPADSDNETSSAAPSDATDSGDSAPGIALTGQLCDALTAELAASVDPAITRQTLNTPNQCGWSGKGGAVLFLSTQTLEQAGATDEDAWFDAASVQYEVPLTDLDVGDRGAVLRDPDGAIVEVLWTVDHTIYWTLLGTFKQDDDATYDAVVEVARTLASGG